jgi:hypothetical protein
MDKNKTVDKNYAKLLAIYQALRLRRADTIDKMAEAGISDIDDGGDGVVMQLSILDADLTAELDDIGAKIAKEYWPQADGPYYTASLADDIMRRLRIMAMIIGSQAMHVKRTIAAGDTDMGKLACLHYMCADLQAYLPMVDWHMPARRLILLGDVVSA